MDRNNINALLLDTYITSNVGFVPVTSINPPVTSTPSVDYILSRLIMDKTVDNIVELLGQCSPVTRGVFLDIAIKCNNLEVVQSIVLTDIQETGSVIDMRMILSAVEFGSIQVLECLLENSHNKDLAYPLMAAIERERLDMVDAILATYLVAQSDCVTAITYSLYLGFAEIAACITDYKNILYEQTPPVLGTYEDTRAE